MKNILCNGFVYSSEEEYSSRQNPPKYIIKNDFGAAYGKINIIFEKNANVIKRSNYQRNSI